MPDEVMVGMAGAWSAKGGLSKNYFMFKVISKTRRPASEAWMRKRFGK
jgi:hypothetical protein